MGRCPGPVQAEADLPQRQVFRQKRKTLAAHPVRAAQRLVPAHEHVLLAQLLEAAASTAALAVQLHALGQPHEAMHAAFEGQGDVAVADQPAITEHQIAGLHEPKQPIEATAFTACAGQRDDPADHAAEQIDAGQQLGHGVALADALVVGGLAVLLPKGGRVGGDEAHAIDQTDAQSMPTRGLGFHRLIDGLDQPPQHLQGKPLICLAARLGADGQTRDMTQTIQRHPREQLQQKQMHRHHRTELALPPGVPGLAAGVLDQRVWNINPAAP